jgi:hypothetical protein
VLNAAKILSLEELLLSQCYSKVVVMFSFSFGFPEIWKQAHACLVSKMNTIEDRLNLVVDLIGQFMWAEQIKSYNGNTIVSVSQNALITEVKYRVIN